MFNRQENAKFRDNIQILEDENSNYYQQKRMFYNMIQLQDAGFFVLEHVRNGHTYILLATPSW